MPKPAVVEDPKVGFASVADFPKDPNEVKDFHRVSLPNPPLLEPPAAGAPKPVVKAGLAPVSDPALGPKPNKDLNKDTKA